MPTGNLHVSYLRATRAAEIQSKGSECAHGRSIMCGRSGGPGMGEQGVTPSQSPTVLQENLILSPDCRSVSKDASDKERRGGERKGWELQTRFQVFRA